MAAPAGDEAGAPAGDSPDGLVAVGGEVRSRALVVIGITIAAITVIAMVVASIWATFIIE